MNKNQVKPNIIMKFFVLTIIINFIASFWDLIEAIAIISSLNISQIQTNDFLVIANLFLMSSSFILIIVAFIFKLKIGRILISILILFTFILGIIQQFFVSYSIYSGYDLLTYNGGNYIYNFPYTFIWGSYFLANSNVKKYFATGKELEEIIALTEKSENKDQAVKNDIIDYFKLQDALSKQNAISIELLPERFLDFRYKNAIDDFRKVESIIVKYKNKYYLNIDAVNNPKKYKYKKITKTIIIFGGIFALTIILYNFL